MTTDDLMSFYGCKTRKQLAIKMELSSVTLWKWEKFGIPPKTQSHIQVTTKGKLKAESEKVPGSKYQTNSAVVL